MKRILLSLLTCWLLVATVQAQQSIGRLDIHLNKNILEPGDSLFITVDYKDSGSKQRIQSLATLELVIENEEGMRTSPYLQGRIAGLQISSFGFNGGSARWRGSPVTFFLDEMRVSAQMIGNIPMADIAIVKAYPPPFFGTTGGGGAIAVYTRRGGEADFLPANRQVFKVRGYTSSAVALEMDKLNL